MTSESDNVGTLPHSSLLILIWVCFGAAFLLVAVRTVIRIRSPTTSRFAPLEDCWILLALAALLALCVLETIQLPSLYYITGILTGAVPLTTFEAIVAQTEHYLRFQFPITILFWTVLWSVKAAFLALYWRLFRDLKWYRRAWFVLAVFTFLTYGGCVITLCLSCGPDIRNFFAFNKCNGPQHVWSSNFSVYFSTAVDLFTDLCIMAMPLRLIYNVKVSLKQKIGLVCVFSLGFVMIVFAIIRANQTLSQQGFVNLTMMMVWSTLAAAICKFLWQPCRYSTDRPSRPRRDAPRPQGPHHHARTRLREPLWQRRVAEQHEKEKLQLRYAHQERQKRRPRLTPEGQQPEGGREVGRERVAGGDFGPAGCGESEDCCLVVWNSDDVLTCLPDRLVQSGPAPVPHPLSPEIPGSIDSKARRQAARGWSWRLDSFLGHPTCVVLMILLFLRLCCEKA
jgi:hypothetical protein